MKKQLILAISGVKNSGKTTLIQNIIPVLKSQGLRVSTIKHDGHDFEPDVPKTDTFKHRKSGANGVAIFSKNRFMITKECETDEKALIEFFKDSDIILLEGFKNSDYPKIEIVRGENSKDTVCDKNVVAVVSDVVLGDNVFGLEDYVGVGEFVFGLYKGVLTMDNDILSELKTVYEIVKKEQHFAESKNIAFTVLYGTLFTVTMNMPKDYPLIYSTSLITLFFAMLLLIISFIPKLSGKVSKNKKAESDGDSLIYFKNIATFKDAEKYIKAINNNTEVSNISALEKSYADSIIINSQITLSKFVLFSYSVRIFLIGLGIVIFMILTQLLS